MLPTNGPDMAAIASLVGHIGKQSLPAALDDLLGTVAPFDLSAIFGFPFDQRPLLLHNGYVSDGASPAALEAYLGGAYLLDPFYTACTQNRARRILRRRLANAGTRSRRVL